MFKSTRIDHPKPLKTKPLKLFTDAYLILYQWVHHILTVVAAAIRGVLLTPLRRLWVHYQPRVAFVEQHLVMPPSALGFIITVLLAFAEIKSQCEPGFPFKTHPHLLRLSINCLVMYGLSYAAELIASGLDCTSVFVILPGLGKICSLCVLVTSLACLFYF